MLGFGEYEVGIGERHSSIAGHGWHGAANRCEGRHGNETGTKQHKCTDINGHVQPIPDPFAYHPCLPSVILLSYILYRKCTDDWCVFRDKIAQDLLY